MDGTVGTDCCTSSSSFHVWYYGPYDKNDFYPGGGKPTSTGTLNYRRAPVPLQVPSSKYLFSISSTTQALLYLHSSGTIYRNKGLKKPSMLIVPRFVPRLVTTSLHVHLLLLCNQPIFANGLKVPPSPLRITRITRRTPLAAIINNNNHNNNNNYNNLSSCFQEPTHRNFSSSTFVKMSPQGSGDNDDNHYDDHSSAGEWKTFDPNTCQGVYGLGISAVAPRPVAVITSRSENGTLNCAPFS